MTNRLRRLGALALTLIAAPALAEPPVQWSIAIHGGAGTMSREEMTEEKRTDYEAALQAALDAAAKVLRDGGSAIEAVRTVIVLLEDDPRFNAGRGAVFTDRKSVV